MKIFDDISPIEKHCMSNFETETPPNETRREVVRLMVYSKAIAITRTLLSNGINFEFFFVDGKVRFDLTDENYQKARKLLDNNWQFAGYGAYIELSW
jgi:hypothetical protein